MEADLQRYYHVDLRDLWTGRLTLRRVKVLLAGLPGDSLLATAIRQMPDAKPQQGDIDDVRWGTVHELMAAQIDAMREIKWAVFQAQSNKTVAKPDPFPRPGTGKSKRRGMSAVNRNRIQGWIQASRNQTRQESQHGD